MYRELVGLFVLAMVSVLPTPSRSGPASDPQSNDPPAASSPADSSVSTPPSTPAECAAVYTKTTSDFAACLQQPLSAATLASIDEQLIQKNQPLMEKTPSQTLFDYAFAWCTRKKEAFPGASMYFVPDCVHNYFIGPEQQQANAALNDQRKSCIKEAEGAFWAARNSCVWLAGNLYASDCDWRPTIAGLCTSACSGSGCEPCASYSADLRNSCDIKIRMQHLNDKKIIVTHVGPCGAALDEGQKCRDACGGPAVAKADRDACVQTCQRAEQLAWGACWMARGEAVPPIPSSKAGVGQSFSGGRQGGDAKASRPSGQRESKPGVAARSDSAKPLPPSPCRNGQRCETRTGTLDRFDGLGPSYVGQAGSTSVRGGAGQAGSTASRGGGGSTSSGSASNAKPTFQTFSPGIMDTSSPKPK